MNEDRPPLMFLADATGLDYLNSVGTPTDHKVEWLGSGEDLLKWLEQAKLVPSDVLQKLRETAGPDELDAIAIQARSLREWFRKFVVAYKGKPIPAEAIQGLEPLNKLLARDERFGHIAANQGDGTEPKLFLESMRRWRLPEALLLPIAEAMAELICQEDFSHIKACEGPACSLLFLDKTRGHARRWCSMAVCGNRAKQAAHRTRTKSIQN